MLFLVSIYSIQQIVTNVSNVSILVSTGDMLIPSTFLKNVAAFTSLFCRERRDNVYRGPDEDRAQELGGVVRGHRVVCLLRRFHWRNYCPHGTRHPRKEESAEERS